MISEGRVYKTAEELITFIINLTYGLFTALELN